MKILSIKSKVALASTLALLAVITVICTIQAVLLRADMRRVLEAQQLAMVTSLADELDDKITSRLNAMRRLVTMLPMENAYDRAMLQDVLAKRPLFQTQFEAAAVIDKDGLMLARHPVDARASGLQVANQPWFKAALVSGKPVVSEPVKGLVNGQPHVILAIPIHAEDGSVAGVLAASLELTQPNFLGRLGAARLGERGGFTIFSRERTVIMSHDAGRLLTSGPPAGQFAPLDRAINGLSGSQIVESVPGWSGLISYKPLRSLPWILMAVLPADEAFAPITQSQIQLLLAMALVTLVSLPLVWLVTRRLLAPLSRLHDVIRHNREHPEVPLLPPADPPGDEIGDLAADFNALMQERAAADERTLERTRELEASNRELSAFSHTAAHDLRAPLRHIAFFAGELQQTVGATLDANASGLLARIICSTKQQSELIDGLLEYAKLQQQTLDMAPVELDTLVRGLVDEAKAGGSARPDTEWRLEQLPTVQGDRALLGHLFANLIDNAVKYSAKRDKPVIEIGWQAAAADRVEIRVRDNGAGFEPEYAHRLFGMFQRLHRREDFPGTGIGLALVRRIAERLGGSVHAQGELGKGAVFSVVLRLARGAPLALGRIA